jgi:hypothetical protein
VRRNDLELDQTGSLLGLKNSGGIGARLGARIAEHPEFLFFNRLLTGATASRATDTFEGNTYNLTLDGVSMFNTAHPSAYGSTQSNIIAGSLPTTAAGVAAQTVEATAKQLQQDMNKIIQHFKNLKDDRGVKLFPTFDAKKHLIIAVPSILEQASYLAFKTNSSTALIGTTTNVTPLFVKDVIPTGLLDGAPNVLDEGSTGEITPLNETDYYVFFDGDLTKALYMLYHSPLQTPYGESSPVDSILKSYGDIGATQDSATFLASTSIESTLNRVGNQADAHSIMREEYLISPRMRGNCFFGPWMNALRVYPTSGIASN